MDLDAFRFCKLRFLIDLAKNQKGVDTKLVLVTFLAIKNKMSLLKECGYFKCTFLHVLILGIDDLYVRLQ